MSCKIYPPEIPIKDCRLPKYLPQQFGPYYDNDPNSVIKYKEIPTYLTSRLQTDIKNKQLLNMEVRNHLKTELIEQNKDALIEDKAYEQETAAIIEPFYYDTDAQNYTSWLCSLCIIIVICFYFKLKVDKSMG